MPPRARSRAPVARGDEPAEWLVPPERPADPSALSGGRLAQRLRQYLAGVPPHLVTDPGRRGIAALAVVVVLACVVAGWLAWSARPRPEPVTAVQERVGAPPVDAAPVGAVPAAAPVASPAEVVVAVEGDVRRPGLIRLPSGARVADAIEAAGGLTPRAQVRGLNLARKVTDGELVTVGGPPPVGPADEGQAAGDTGRRVDLNTATVADLDGLPGVGPVLAQRIVDHRLQHGPFRSVEELRDVDGIGEARFADLRDLVTV